MSTELRVPGLGQGATEGTLTEWLASDGAEIKAGDVVYAIEGDKSVQEIEAPANGVLRIIAEAGETYPVGTLIGVIE